MSELKARRIGQLMSETGRCDTEVYIKSEADKVIAELKCQVNGLQNRSNLWHYNAVEEHKKFVQADKEIAELTQSLEQVKRAAHTLRKKMTHQKHKRCLAMAKWCECRWADIATQYYKSVLYRKWQLRWLELAEKFKDKEA